MSDESTTNSSNSPHHLFIGGSGAVGSIYAHHLSKSGHKITMYLKSSNAKQLQENGNEIVLYDLMSRVKSILLVDVISLILVILFSKYVIRLHFEVILTVSVFCILSLFLFAANETHCKANI